MGHEGCVVCAMLALGVPAGLAVYGAIHLAIWRATGCIDVQCGEAAGGCFNKQAGAAECAGGAATWSAHESDPCRGGCADRRAGYLSTGRTFTAAGSCTLLGLGVMIAVARVAARGCGAGGGAVSPLLRVLPPARASAAGVCTICMDALVAGAESACAETPCGHAFHRACITKWLEARRACPNCVAPV